MSTPHAPFDELAPTVAIMTLFCLSSVLSAMLNILAYNLWYPGGVHQVPGMALAISLFVPPALITWAIVRGPHKRANH